jgi:hypothetical protein
MYGVDSIGPRRRAPTPVRSAPGRTYRQRIRREP